MGTFSLGTVGFFKEYMVGCFLRKSNAKGEETCWAGAMMRSLLPLCKKDRVNWT